MLRRESPNQLGKSLVGAQSQSAPREKNENTRPAGTRTPLVQSLSQSTYQATPTVDSRRNDHLCISRKLWHIFSNLQPRCILANYVICVPLVVTCRGISNSWKASLNGAESINVWKLIYAFKTIKTIPLQACQGL
jgi:hypothetical protein